MTEQVCTETADGLHCIGARNEHHVCCACGRDDVLDGLREAEAAWERELYRWGPHPLDPSVVRFKRVLGDYTAAVIARVEAERRRD